MKNSKFARFLSYGIKDFIDRSVPDKALLLAKVRKDWEQIVGKNIYQHSWPDSIKNTTLYINVDDPIWIQELSFHKDDIRDNILKHYKDERFQKVFEFIKIKNGEIKHSSSVKEDRTDFSLDPEVLKKIDKTLTGVDDKDLKDALKKYLVKINMVEK